MLTCCTAIVARGGGLKLKPAGLQSIVRLGKYSTKVLESPYGEIQVPDQTLSQFIWSRAQNWKDLPAVSCGVSGRSYTFEQAQGMCDLGARSLLSNTGLKPGERMALLLPNIPEYLVAVHAGLRAGLVITFANPLYTVHELTRQFQNCKARCIVTIPQLLDAALQVAKGLDNYDCTICIGGKPDPGNKVLGLESLLGPSKEVDLPQVSSEDVAVLPYSSGTTGVPKGVKLTHRSLVTNIVQLSDPRLVANTDPLGPEPQKTVLTVLPFFHIYGFNTILNYLTYWGAHLISLPKFTPQDYLRCLAEYKPSVLFVVPSLLLFLITHPEVKPEHLQSVKTVFCGAAPMTKTLIDHFFQKIGRDDCCVSQGYGMTETSPGITVTPHSMPHTKGGSCGQLLPSTKARVIDLSTGSDVSGPQQPGELIVKGPQLMNGYLDNEAATKEVIDTDGWLHTGDVVYYDEDEYFYIVDRTKELIKVKGNQVSPTELESLILEIPGVADAAVIGIPDAVAGELPKAFVVKKPGFDKITPDHVQEFVTSKVAEYKKLAGGVSFIEAIPRNPSGKILRNELKSLSS
ncbi:hypothetical protein QAD02_019196 [Eretmocerus hayati]|uniref:Uncharacterized protein n=1 Tax=Eretmocerus hayati TaxID=131215 RepID=A0ACC2PLD1_9HYME|nr:hypothetical protein QAD02_019196 [Eretmocerus hayati]